MREGMGPVHHVRHCAEAAGKADAVAAVADLGSVSAKSAVGGISRLSGRPPRGAQAGAWPGGARVTVRHATARGVTPPLSDLYPCINTTSFCFFSLPDSLEKRC